MKIAAIMPCRGRAEQTVRNVRRLLATAGYDDWRLWLAGGENDIGTIWQAISQADIAMETVSYAASPRPQVTYWQALEMVTRQTDATHLVNLANDLLPGQHWLGRAFIAYQQTFGIGPGMIGFNGDSHEVGHSCHFLISRDLLDRYGGWPVWYQHNFGDTELVQRATQDDLYAKATWALLFHDHPYFGGQDDAIYAEGRASSSRDEALYHERRRQGWPRQRI